MSMRKLAPTLLVLALGCLCGCRGVGAPGAAANAFPQPPAMAYATEDLARIPAAGALPIAEASKP